MNTTVNSINGVPKLALNRIETVQAISQSPATVDGLTKRGLLRPCRATRRPFHAVKEIERFLKATTPDSDWTARKPLGETSFENFPPIFREPVGMSKTRNTSTLAGYVSTKSQHLTEGNKMTVKVLVLSDRSDEYTGKKGLVKQQIITVMDQCDTGDRLGQPIENAMSDEEKPVHAGKLQDKVINLAIRELIPFGGRLRARGKIVSLVGK